MADGTAPIGHNNPPPDPFGAIKAHISDLYAEAKGFLDGLSDRLRDHGLEIWWLLRRCAKMLAEPLPRHD